MTVSYTHNEIHVLTLKVPGPSAGMGGSLDSYCSLKPLCLGLGEVVPARTSLTLLPHPLALCCHYPVSKCRSASIAVTGTIRVNLQLWIESLRPCQFANILNEGLNYNSGLSV